MNTERIPHYQTKRDSMTCSEIEKQKLVGEVDIGEYRMRKDDWTQAHVVYTMHTLLHPLGQLVALTIIWS